jgi:hypothetical protein
MKKEKKSASHPFFHTLFPSSPLSHLPHTHTHTHTPTHPTAHATTHSTAGIPLILYPFFFSQHNQKRGIHPAAWVTYQPTTTLSPPHPKYQHAFLPLSISPFVLTQRLSVASPWGTQTARQSGTIKRTSPSERDRLVLKAVPPDTAIGVVRTCNHQTEATDKTFVSGRVSLPRFSFITISYFSDPRHLTRTATAAFCAFAPARSVPTSLCFLTCPTCLAAPFFFCAGRQLKDTSGEAPTSFPRPLLLALQSSALPTPPLVVFFLLFLRVSPIHHARACAACRRVQPAEGCLRQDPLFVFLPFRPCFSTSLTALHRLFNQARATCVLLLLLLLRIIKRRAYGSRAIFKLATHTFCADFLTRCAPNVSPARAPCSRTTITGRRRQSFLSTLCSSTFKPRAPSPSLLSITGLGSRQQPRSLPFNTRCRPLISNQSQWPPALSLRWRSWPPWRVRLLANLLKPTL